MTTKNTQRVSAAAKQAQAASISIAEEEPKKPIVPTAMDLHQIVAVYNGFYGKLVYESRRTGELFVWNDFGDVQYMEIGELRNARSTSKKYFSRNWFMFDEPWILDYLGVQSYYAGALGIDEFDEVFSKSAEEVKQICSGLSSGQKRSLAYRARILMQEGAIDSHKTITALEDALGIELIER